MNYTFNHIASPTNEERNWDGFYEPGRIHYTEFDKDQYQIEWVKFDNNSPMPEMMRTLPHVAYLVDEMEQALKGCEILEETFSPAEGVRVAFIVHKGSPVEFMEISK